MGCSHVNEVTREEERECLRCDEDGYEVCRYLGMVEVRYCTCSDKGYWQCPNCLSETED